MTTKARQQEADRATGAFQLALTSIGVEYISDALVLWEDVPDPQKPEQAQAWLDKAIHLIMTRRTLSVQLARAYYRLVRALRTGKTVADPFHPEPKVISIQKLRSEFSALAGPRLNDQARQSLLSSDTGNASRNRAQGDGGATEALSDSEADRILVEEIEGLKAQEEADAQAADAEARAQIEQLGVKNRDKLYDQLDTSKPADEIDKARLDAHDQAGARQAAAGERIVKNGARSTVWSTAERDPLVVGYIRVSLTGTPCGFCAMLISRGVVYKSKRSAEYVDGDKYHDNCNCVAVPIYSLSDYRSSDRYALNREYARLWPQVTRGYSGKAALAVWRRYFRQQQSLQRAQAARPTTNVQEA